MIGALAEAMSDGRLAADLRALAANLRYATPVQRAAILTEAARRLETQETTR
jgi:hypothetical protein